MPENMPPLRRRALHGLRLVPRKRSVYGSELVSARAWFAFARRECRSVHATGAYQRRQVPALYAKSVGER